MLYFTPVFLETTSGIALETIFIKFSDKKHIKPRKVFLNLSFKDYSILLIHSVKKIYRKQMQVTEIDFY